MCGAGGAELVDSKAEPLVMAEHCEANATKARASEQLFKIWLRPSLVQNARERQLLSFSPSAHEDAIPAGRYKSPIVPKLARSASA
jgi:hypothetical protein